MFGGGTALDDRLLAIAKGRLSDLNAVRQALQAYADFAFEDQVRFRTLFLKHYGEGGRAFHAHGSRRPGTEAFRQRIDAAIESGVFRKLDPDLALQVLWGAVHGVSRWFSQLKASRSRREPNSSTPQSRMRSAA